MRNYDNDKLRLIEYENKIAMLSQEIERLTEMLDR